jgi:hypothetical protein
MTDVQVGGDKTSLGNVISGNGGDGITINGGGANVSHSILGNRIGVPAGADTDLHNDGRGITITDASDIVIGPLDPTSTTLLTNTIAFNGPSSVSLSGVRVLGDGSGTTAQDVQIRGNSIYSNGGPGIDLQGGANAVTGATSVPPPDLRADNNGGDITVYGTIGPAGGTDCATPAGCVIDIYTTDSTTTGGKNYLASINVIDNGGTLEYSGVVPGLVEDDFITATRTDGRETSTFKTRIQIPDDGGSSF